MVVALLGVNSLLLGTNSNQKRNDTVMKKYIYATLLSSVAILFAGCSDELENNFTTKYAGEDIVFGGRATYELDESRNKAPETRTVYTGTFLGADGKEWVSGTKYEVIHWVSGDKVRIFSAEAAGATVADYSVNVNDTDATGETELSKVSSVGLQWSNNTQYDFYAVYPSPHQYPLKDNQLDPAVDAAVLNGSKTILGRIPAVQECLGTPSKVGTSWTLKPKMEYAYMVAHQKVENANKTSAEIYLNFVPIATAVEIELVNKSNRALELANILVSSATDGTALTGDFTADLSKLTIGTEKNIYTGIPEDGFITNVSNTGTQISIPAYQGVGGLTGDPISLANGESIKFTLFMLPNQNIDDLKITLVGIEGTRMGTTNGITITKHKKTFLNQMPISQKTGDYDQSRWIEFLPDNAYLKGLSIPGAGGASSGHTANWDDNKLFLEQSLTIEQLWAQGIRCFEFTVDKAADNASFGTQNVICNNISTGVTLAAAVKAVKDKLVANPAEFAMVIITYQQASGWNVRQDDGSVNQTRVPATFMTQLNYFWDLVKNGTHATVGAWPESTATDGIQTGTELYSTNMTVEAARGKLFCIARPTSNGEDNYAEVTTTRHGGGWFLDPYWYELTKTSYPKAAPDTPSVTNEDILVIHGWGALKDKWYARGFSDCVYKRGVGNGHFNAAVALDETTRNTLLGYTVNSSRPGRPFDVADNSGNNYSTLPNKANGYAEKTSELDLTVDFYYSTITNNGVLQTKKAWVQEWARVVEEPTTFTIESGKYARWISSIDEKKQHISDCLDYALTKKINGTPVDDVIFINSLCGYYVSNDNVNSARPNSLTDCNIANQYENTYSGKWKFNRLTGASSTAGMCGNIAGFATAVNSYFYSLLQNTTTNPDFEPGPMGIILMDRVSSNKDDDGSKIPSIIIANNFQHTLPAAPATYSLRKSNYEEGDRFAAPAQRGVKGADEGVSIVWE